MTEAVLLLDQSLRTGIELGSLLEAAQAAISEQGYRTEEPTPPFDDQGHGR